jgi:hypothetical protein
VSICAIQHSSGVAADCPAPAALVTDGSRASVNKRGGRAPLGGQSCITFVTASAPGRGASSVKTVANNKDDVMSQDSP